MQTFIKKRIKQLLAQRGLAIAGIRQSYMSAEETITAADREGLPDEPIHRTERSIIRCLAVERMVPKKAPLLLLEAFRPKPLDFSYTKETG